MLLENDGTLIEVTERETQGKNYYRMSVLVNGDAGTYGTTQEMYARYVDGKIKKMGNYKIRYQYNDRYGSLRIVDLFSLE